MYYIKIGLTLLVLAIATTKCSDLDIPTDEDIKNLGKNSTKKRSLFHNPIFQSVFGGDRSRPLAERFFEGSRGNNQPWTDQVNVYQKGWNGPQPVIASYRAPTHQNAQVWTSKIPCGLNHHLPQVLNQPHPPAESRPQLKKHHSKPKTDGPYPQSEQISKKTTVTIKQNGKNYNLKTHETITDESGHQTKSKTEKTVVLHTKVLPEINKVVPFNTQWEKLPGMTIKTTFTGFQNKLNTPPSMKDGVSFGKPGQHNEKYDLPSQPDQKYNMPDQPEKNYGLPSQPEPNYGIPSPPAEKYGVPSQPANNYGVPTKPAETYFNNNDKHPKLIGYVVAADLAKHFSQLYETPLRIQIPIPDKTSEHLRPYPQNLDTFQLQQLYNIPNVDLKLGHENRNLQTYPKIHEQSVTSYDREIVPAADRFGLPYQLTQQQAQKILYEAFRIVHGQKYAYQPYDVHGQPQRTFTPDGNTYIVDSNSQIITDSQNQPHIINETSEKTHEKYGVPQTTERSTQNTPLYPKEQYGIPQTTSKAPEITNGQLINYTLFQALQPQYRKPEGQYGLPQTTPKTPESSYGPPTNIGPFQAPQQQPKFQHQAHKTWSYSFTVSKNSKYPSVDLNQYKSPHEKNRTASDVHSDASNIKNVVQVSETSFYQPSQSNGADKRPSENYGTPNAPNGDLNSQNVVSIQSPQIPFDQPNIEHTQPDGADILPSENYGKPSDHNVVPNAQNVVPGVQVPQLPFYPPNNQTKQPNGTHKIPSENYGKPSDHNVVPNAQNVVPGVQAPQLPFYPPNNQTKQPNGTNNRPSENYGIPSVHYDVPHVHSFVSAVHAPQTRFYQPSIKNGQPNGDNKGPFQNNSTPSAQYDGSTGPKIQTPSDGYGTPDKMFLYNIPGWGQVMQKLYKNNTGMEGLKEVYHYKISNFGEVKQEIVPKSSPNSKISVTFDKNYQAPQNNLPMITKLEINPVKTAVEKNDGYALPQTSGQKFQQEFQSAVVELNQNNGVPVQEAPKYPQEKVVYQYKIPTGGSVKQVIGGSVKGTQGFSKNEKHHVGKSELNQAKFYESEDRNKSVHDNFIKQEHYGKPKEVTKYESSQWKKVGFLKSTVLKDDKMIEIIKGYLPKTQIKSQFKPAENFSQQKYFNNNEESLNSGVININISTILPKITQKQTFSKAKANEIINNIILPKTKIKQLFNKSSSLHQNLQVVLPSNDVKAKPIFNESSLLYQNSYLPKIEIKQIPTNIVLPSTDIAEKFKQHPKKVLTVSISENINVTSNQKNSTDTTINKPHMHFQLPKNKFTNFEKVSFTTEKYLDSFAESVRYNSQLFLKKTKEKTKINPQNTINNNSKPLIFYENQKVVEIATKPLDSYINQKSEVPHKNQFDEYQTPKIVNSSVATKSYLVSHNNQKIEETRKNQFVEYQSPKIVNSDITTKPLASHNNQQVLKTLKNQFVEYQGSKIVNSDLATKPLASHKNKTNLETHKNIFVKYQSPKIVNSDITTKPLAFHNNNQKMVETLKNQFVEYQAPKIENSKSTKHIVESLLNNASQETILNLPEIQNYFTETFKKMNSSEFNKTSDEDYRKRLIKDMILGFLKTKNIQKSAELVRYLNITLSKSDINPSNSYGLNLTKILHFGNNTLLKTTPETKISKGFDFNLTNNRFSSNRRKIGYTSSFLKLNPTSSVEKVDENIHNGRSDIPPGPDENQKSRNVLIENASSFEGQNLRDTLTKSRFLRPIKNLTLNSNQNFGQKTTKMNTTIDFGSRDNSEKFTILENSSKNVTFLEDGTKKVLVKVLKRPMAKNSLVVNQKQNIVVSKLHTNR